MDCQRQRSDSWMKQSAAQFLNGLKSNATLPSVDFGLTEQLRDKNAEIADIAFLIEHDPPLAMAILRMANSVVFNRGLRVGTVNRAITRLGLKQTMELVTGITIARSMNKLSVDPEILQRFWQHSVYTAGASRILSMVAGTGDSDFAFTAGLVHDIGELLLHAHSPDDMAEAIRLTDAGEQRNRQAAEQAVFGFDHAELGHQLALDWQLAAPLCDAIRHHHDPVVDDESQALAIVVCAASSLAKSVASRDEIIVDPADHIESEAVWARLNLTLPELPNLVQSLRAFTGDLEKLVSLSSRAH